MTDPMFPLARLLRTTPGQAWTIVLGLLLSCALMTASLGAVLRAGTARSAPAPVLTPDPSKGTP